MRRRLSIYLGGGIIALLLVATLAAPLLSPQNPYEMELAQGLAAPETAHPFGRDKLGRDILSRVLHGGRTSLTVGFAAVSVSVLLGVIIGGIAGYLGGVWDEAIMRVTDVFLAFPGILLAIALMSVLAPSLWNIVISLSVFGWVGYARLVRAQVLALREREFVIAAHAAGATPGRILTLHLFTNVISPVIVEASIGMAGAILAESGLSFLGLGIQPPEPSWGAMLAEGRDFLLVAPHLTIYPGIAIALTVMGLNILGDGLRDLLDPTQKR